MISATAVFLLFFLAILQNVVSEKTACQRLNEEYSHTKEGVLRSNNSVFIYGRERQVSVYWDGREPSRAAAALLATVLRHGLRYQGLSLKKNYGTICHVTHQMQATCTEYDQSDKIYNNLLLIPAIGWIDGYCPSMEICSHREVVPLRLQVAGGSAAPLRLRMHVMIITSARSQPRCQNASYWDFYKNQDFLVKCGFTSNIESMPAILWYTTSAPGWNKILTTLTERLNTSLLLKNFNISPLKSYKDLHHRIESGIQTQNSSFLFLDYDIWETVPGIQLMQPPPCSEDDCGSELDSISSLRAADVPVLQQFAPDLLKVFEYFSPSPSQIREVLEINMKQSRDDIGEAACAWVANNTAIFESWYQIEFKQQYWIAAFLCSNDEDKNNYIKTVRKVEEFYRTITKFYISVYFIEVDCSSESDLTNKFLKITMSNRWSYLIGAIAAGAGAKMAAEYAPQMETALVLYDMPSAGVRLGPTVHAAGGTLKQLLVATRHFILLHKWKRLAIFSEETELAKDFVEGLKEDELLVIRNIYLNSSTTIIEHLQSLKYLNTRIFLLNSNSSISKEILCFAQELGMTPSNEYVWILREWHVRSLKCASSFDLHNTNLITISYWWQGHNDARLLISSKNSIISSPFLNTLKTLNESQYFLPLTIPMADAIQILIRKFDSFIRKFPSRLYDIHGSGSSRLILKTFEEQYFDGVLQKLHYINGTLIGPYVFITQWIGNQPTFVTKWTVTDGEIGIENSECIYNANSLSDGSRRCYTTTVGDSFNPNCQDYLWFTIGGCFLLLVCLLCFSWRTRFRNLTQHDSILRAQLLAKEVLSNALVNHLVDRGALEIYHDIGRGNFGRVRYGVLRAPERLPVAVAVKELLDYTPTEESELLHEAVTLASLQHPHIVRLIGVCTSDGPLLVLMEYAFFGNLQDYLCKRRHLVKNSSECPDVFDEAFHVSSQSLTRLAREVVSALGYLTTERLVHRDIRAINCLINEQRSLKLSDFGLARVTGAGAPSGDEEYLSQRRGMFPVRWMAPESLQLGVFTAASDVWALGVLLLELTTLGARPYGNWPLNSVLEYVCAGGHPPLPSDILPEIRQLMLQCWEQEPESRLTVSEIARILENNSSMLRPALGLTESILDDDHLEP